MTAAPPIPSEDSQPGLFPVDALPNDVLLVAAAKKFIHSGKITCKAEERAAAIAQAFLECGQVLTVAKRFHISPNSVHAVLRVLEENGKLDDLKQRVSRNLGLIAELGCERLIEKLESGCVSANVLPIVVGVAVDKKAILDGTGPISGEAPPRLTIEVHHVLDYLRQRGLPVPAIDVESTVTTTKANDKP
jgi:transposase-like protein